MFTRDEGFKSFLNFYILEAIPIDTYSLLSLAPCPGGGKVIDLQKDEIISSKVHLQTGYII